MTAVFQHAHGAADGSVEHAHWRQVDANRQTGRADIRFVTVEQALGPKRRAPLHQGTGQRGAAGGQAHELVESSAHGRGPGEQFAGPAILVANPPLLIRAQEAVEHRIEQLLTARFHDLQAIPEAAQRQNGAHRPGQ